MAEGLDGCKVRGQSDTNPVTATENERTKMNGRRQAVLDMMDSIFLENTRELFIS